MSSKLQSREYAGNFTQPDVNIFKKESFKENQKPRVLDEDYFLYYLKNMFKDNLNEYPNKQLERPNKFDLTNLDDRELTLMEDKKWKDHDLLLEQRSETFKNFTFPKHMSPQEKCIDQLQCDYDDFNMLCLRDMFRDRSTELPGFDRTPAQDKDELKEMSRVHDALLQEKSRLPSSSSSSSSGNKHHMKKRSPLQSKHSKGEKRTIIRQTKTTTTRIFKKPNDGLKPAIPIKTEIISETITKPISSPINDPKSKPTLSTETCYSVDLSNVNNNSWIWSNGEIKKL